MRINRGLTAKVLFAMMLVVMVAAYQLGYFSKVEPPLTVVPGVETTLCAEFADTYEHNSKDENHVHLGNLYAVDLQGNHLYTTKDYMDWLRANLSAFTTAANSAEYQDISSDKLAGMLYSMYRWCRASPMEPFVSVIPPVLNHQPAPKPADMYQDDPEGE